MSFARRGFIDQPVVANQLAANATGVGLTLTAPLVLPAGTVSAPALKFTGSDVGTGLSAATVDQITAGRAGVAHFTLTAAGGPQADASFATTSNLNVQGRFAPVSETVKTINYEVSTSDSVVIMNGSTLTATLPATPGAQQTVWIKNIDAGTCTIARNGITIDGAASDITLAASESALLHYNGTAWYRLGS